MPPQRHPLARCVLYALCFLVFPLAARAGADVLLTKSGDRLVGEVKKLERGLLYFETDYGDNVFVIDWDEVRSLESKEYFAFRTAKGRRYSGSFWTDPADSSAIIIDAAEGPVQIKGPDLVFLESVERGFINRFSASLDFGYTFTKANGSQQLTTRGMLGYRAERFYSDIALNAVSNVQQSAENSRKADLSFNQRYFFHNNWYSIFTLMFETSDEQLLDLRSSGSLGIGTYVVSTQRLELTLAAGGSYVNEQFQHSEAPPAEPPLETPADTPSLNSAESFGTLEFNVFDIGDLSFLSSLSVYPSLTERGRVRSKFKADLKWDLPLNFTFKLGLTHNYDSKPPNEAGKSDYVFSTTVGWEL